MDNEELFNLIRQAVAGDQAVRNRVIFHYMPAIRKYLHKRMQDKTLGIQDADDVFQSVMNKLCSSFPGTKFEAVESFEAWLFSVTDTVYLDAVRKANRKKERMQGQALAPPPDSSSLGDLYDLIAGCVPTASVCVVRDEQIRALQLAIANLQTNYRMAVQSYHIDKNTLEQTAELLNTTPDAVRGVLHRAKLKLSAELHLLFSSIL